LPKIFSQLQRNTIANFVGKGWTVLASFLFVPLYVTFLGVEAYGLIGFYAMLQGVLAFADMGLGAALTREMARLSAIKGSEQASRNLLRTLEIVFWLIAVSIASLVAFLAPTIAHNWVNAQQLSPDAVAKVVSMMGIAIALVWPWSVYQGCLMGLQRQVASNGILVAMATLRGVGSVVILWQVSPTIEAFFAWQILVNTLQTALGWWFSWHSMPISGVRARYQNSVFRTIWRFAAGMMGITVMSTILTQMDKAVISKLLSLEALGYYTLAGLVAQIPALFSGPISYAVYPRLTQLVTLHDRASLANLYHRACQFVSVLVFSVGLTSAAFSKEIMLVWTGNPVTAQRTYILVTLLLIGSICLALQVVPYFLALAHEWTRLNLIVGLVTIPIVIPLLVVLINRYGAAGGALTWIVINGGTLPIYMHFIHARLLPGEMIRWYVNDVGWPIVAALVPIMLGRWLIPPSFSSFAVIVCIILVGLVALLLASLAASEVRTSVVMRIERIRIRWPHAA
jgi:O-antigen/teichoic acid export membrane protein